MSAAYLIQMLYFSVELSLRAELEIGYSLRIGFARSLSLISNLMVWISHSGIGIYTNTCEHIQMEIGKQGLMHLTHSIILHTYLWMKNPKNSNRVWACASARAWSEVCFIVNHFDIFLFFGFNINTNTNHAKMIRREKSAFIRVTVRTLKVKKKRQFMCVVMYRVPNASEELKKQKRDTPRGVDGVVHNVCVHTRKFLRLVLWVHSFFSFHDTQSSIVFY